MNLDDLWVYFWFKLTSLATLAGVGGALGYLLASMDANRAITVKMLVVKFLSSAFAGIVVFILCKAMELGDLWTAAIVAVFGWLGAEITFLVLQRVIEKKLGLDNSVYSSVAEQPTVIEQTTEDSNNDVK